LNRPWRPFKRRAPPVFELTLSSASNFFVGLGGASIPAASTAFEIARLRRCSRKRVDFSKSAFDLPSVAGSIEAVNGASGETLDVVGGVGN
jgi:hypothetical protein